MNVHIPIADTTLNDGQTYSRQLPVWTSRPLMVKVTTGTNEPINIIVREGGAIRKEVSLPYQQYGVDVDLSFAAPLLKRADRSKAEGTPWFPQQLIEFWSTDIQTRIIIPVFHCDLTYWDTLGSDAALPQPIKPRIPGQTLDIFFPYTIHPSDALQIQAEPVEGAPSSAILPSKYVLGDAMDISYVKKLTIKNVWGNGLDQVINYEDRLMSDVVYDECLQCALRARWNMRNGQWFWTAFKDYFWSNKFTAIRGKGGITEQAEITVNLEYGREWYTVYQELLVSSNIMFDLSIDGINQYQDKRFKAEVTGDTGARWSNSSKTYRQQVRFKTTELQDNYIFPTVPSTPAKPEIVFSAQFNPWTIGPTSVQNVTLQVYGNTSYYAEREPGFFMVTNGTSLLKSSDFEQGGFGGYSPGTSWETWKSNDLKYIRLKAPVPTRGSVYSIITIYGKYSMRAYYLDANGRGISATSWFGLGLGRHNLNIPESAKSVTFLITKDPVGNTQPEEVDQLYIRHGDRYVVIPAGTQYISGVTLKNPGEARTGTVSLRSMAGEVSYPITVNQQKASISLSVENIQVNNEYQGGVLITVITANTDWAIDGAPSWLDFNPTQGTPGTRNIFVNTQANTGAQRVAHIAFRSKDNSNVVKILSVYQAGATGNISVTPNTANISGDGGTQVVKVTSFGNWSVSDRATWITPSAYAGPDGDTNVTLKIAANTTGAERSGYITFRNDMTGNIASITITQRAQVKYLRLEKEYVRSLSTSPIPGYELRINLDTNLEASEIGLEFPANTWYTPEIGILDGKPILEVNLSLNSTGANRSAVFGVKDKVNNKTYPVFVLQVGGGSAAFIEQTPMVSVERQFVDTDPEELPRNCGVFKICVFTNTGGLTVGALPDWLNLKRTELNTSGKYVLEMWEIILSANQGANRRTADISIDGTGIGEFLVLSQVNAGSWYDFDGGNPVFGSRNGGTLTVEIFSNIIDISGFNFILDDPTVDWITASKSGTEVDLSVDLTFEPNTGPRREALIWITRPGSFDYPICFTQFGAI